MTKKIKSNVNQDDKKPDNDSHPDVNHGVTMPTTTGGAQEQIAEILSGANARDSEYMLGLMPVIGNLVQLAQIATQGDSALLPHMVETPGKFYHNLMADHQDALKGMMMLKSLHKVLTEESDKDPLEHQKFLLDMMKHQKEDSGKSENSGVNAQSTSSQLISDMDGPGKKPESG